MTIAATALATVLLWNRKLIIARGNFAWEAPLHSFYYCVFPRGGLPLSLCCTATLPHILFLTSAVPVGVSHSGHFSHLEL